MSRNFHPCKLVPQIHVSHFQSPPDLIETYTIINGYYNIDASLFFFYLMKVEEKVIQRNYIKDVVG